MPIDVEPRSDHLALAWGGRSWREVLTSLGGDPAAADELSDAIASSPYRALCWESPPISRSTLDRPFACVLVSSPALERTRADPGAFADHLGGPGDVATFDNLGGDARLVAPTPSPGEDCGHLAAFLRTASPDRRRALWRAVAAAVEERLGDAPLWVSTAGLGVPWLHVRLDDRPKYYRHAPYRTWPR